MSTVVGFRAKSRTMIICVHLKVVSVVCKNKVTVMSKSSRGEESTKPQGAVSGRPDRRASETPPAIPRWLLKKLVRSVMTLEKPHLRIGKRGVHENLVKHVKRLLEAKGIIKIKVLKNVAPAGKDDARRIGEELVSALGDFARLGEVRGRAIVIYAPSVLERVAQKRLEELKRLSEKKHKKAGGVTSRP